MTMDIIRMTLRLVTPMICDRTSCPFRMNDWVGTFPKNFAQLEAFHAAIS